MGFPLGYLSIVPKTFFLTAYWSSTKGKRSNNFKISAVLHRLWRKTNTDIKTKCFYLGLFSSFTKFQISVPL